MADGTPDTRRSRRARRSPGSVASPVDVTVAVIGAGQAGLSAAYHLRRAGLVAVGESGWETAAATFVVLDDAPQSGGAWQHRWPGLTMADAHGVHDLPGMPLLVPDLTEPAAFAVPYYFAQYEEAFELRVQRPVRVERVESDGDRLLVRSRSIERPDEAVVWRARGLINASGTWQKPFWPAYPGRGGFRGRQLHSHDFQLPEDLADGHVVVIGGGTSAVQLTLLLARVTTTTWVTRRPPQWRDEAFTPEVGREAVAEVDERTRAGLPPQSIVSVTGLPLTPEYRIGITAGVLRARPMFDRITPDGVEWDAPDEPGDGWVGGPAQVEARTLLWCTGFRASLDHLAPLGLRAPGGGIVMDGTQVVADPRIQLVGYGPSASTVGANRAGRESVRNLQSLLGV
ncbi:NAD(P)/FAD-dependent oxidoreductase [Cellulomonas humilata]|uniref:NAD(P)/FAD-dependent oxidoreductase n=1 Tax=Cellulomonas humilata TaxID=144055 RepID=A0A7Y5ZYQ7_9CELL|nr:NAD(P)-binding domain-containing protein [Cellulomonas humilata]NUU15720.1 NAD(P)/FAD-dependent oxidoreductase [Cellulomonas humilata]